MKKLFFCFALALTVLTTAPSADALTLQQQRNQVFVALQTVADSIRSDIADLQALRAASVDATERAVLNRQIQVLYGRLRFNQTSRSLARYTFNADQLDTLITRYSLAVSLS